VRWFLKNGENGHTYLKWEQTNSAGIIILEMTVPDLVAKLRASQFRADAIARLIGYVAIIQKMGWDELHISRQSKHALLKTFRSLGINPAEITF